MGYSTGDSDGDDITDEEYHYFNGNCETNGNPDLDPLDNLSEYIAGTDTTNERLDASGFVVEWAPSVSNR